MTGNKTMDKSFISVAERSTAPPYPRLQGDAFQLRSAIKHTAETSMPISAGSSFAHNFSLIPNRDPAVQLQTDTTLPEESLEKRVRELGPEKLLAGGGGGPVEDTGEGIASIELGLPFGLPEKKDEATADEEKEEEAMAAQTKPALAGSGNYQRISPLHILRRLDQGNPMDRHTRNTVEQFFGEEFGDVRFHYGQKANSLSASLGARAFTIGNHIAFGPGKYQPGSVEGNKLIVHELAHVRQQRLGLDGPIVQRGIGQPGDVYELEADQQVERFSRQAGSETHSEGLSSELPSEAKTQIHRNASQAVFTKPSVQLAFSGSTAASYAKKWALGTNPAYGRMRNDCTSFVSQAMRAGGWSMIVGSSYCDDRKKDSVWWYRRNGCRVDACPWAWCPTLTASHASYTWGGAHNFFKFASTSGRGKSAKHVMDLNIGDVLQMDFRGSGHVGHTMIVTNKTSGNLFLSYHSTDHLDEPFYPAGSKPGILARNPSPPTKYHAWNIT